MYSHRVTFCSGVHSVFNVYTAVLLVSLSVFVTLIHVTVIITTHEMFGCIIHYHKANITHTNNRTLMNSILSLILLEAASNGNESITVSYSCYYCYYYYYDNHHQWIYSRLLGLGHFSVS
jgi:hypothetical protein